MKDNSFLKIISYVFLAIFILIFIASIVFSILFYNYSYSSIEDYFDSQEFSSKYTQSISEIMNSLIYAKQQNYYTIYDENNNFEIYQGMTPVEIQDIKDCYYLAIYENKVFTNVKLRNGSKSVNDLKEYVKENDNFFDVINGEVYSNSNSLSEYAKFWNSLKNITIDYYTIDNNGDENRTYRSATIEDFEIYTSYKKEFSESSNFMIILDIINVLRPYQIFISCLIPISLILSILIIVFLINSIGYVKDSKEIVLNDFDKIPFEFILLIFLVILGCCLAILSEINLKKINLNALISILISFYALNITIFEIMSVTFIKRVKAHKFLENCLFGKIFNIIKKVFLWLLNKIKNVKAVILSNTNISIKFVLILIGYIFISIALVGLFSIIGIILDIWLTIYILYQIILRINSFTKLESALKQVYEGNHKISIEEKELTSEFSNCINYLNNISKGLENAVNESLKAERLKTELITNVSHDIKTPLTSIINYVDLLKLEDIQKEKAKEYIEILDNKSQQLKRLTEDLIEASKASSGNVKLNSEKINIVELLKQAIGEMEDRFKEKNLEIVTEYEKEAFINADSKYMHRIIENLLSNSSKYALENTRVYIETRQDNGRILISIKNISKEKLNITEEELMQRFVRGDKSRTTEGSGLGLAISKSLATLQGGILECKIDGDLFKVGLVFETI